MLFLLLIVLFYVWLVSTVLFCVLFVRKRVLYYCHQVSTHLQLTNISYHISYILPYQKELKCEKVEEEEMDRRSWCRKSSTGTSAFLKQLCDNLRDLSTF